MSLFHHLKIRLNRWRYQGAALLMLTSLQAEELDLDLYLTNGYRQDSISADVHVFNPSGALDFKDQLKTGPLHMYQVGMKGFYHLCNVRIRGSGSCGWSTSGDYTETLHSFIDSGKERSSADIQSAKTTTFTLGGGYSLPISTYLAIIPMAGVSYNGQVFKISKSHIGSQPDPGLDGLRYVNRWRSPWIGVDLALNYCQLQIQGGYEFHLGRWNAHWILSQPPFDIGFSDKRRSNNARGHEGYMDAHWIFSNCIQVGLGVKYQHYSASKGKIRAIDEKIQKERTKSGEASRVKSAKWESLTATFDIGAHF